MPGRSNYSLFVTWDVCRRCALTVRDMCSFWVPRHRTSCTPSAIKESHLSNGYEIGSRKTNYEDERREYSKDTTACCFDRENDREANLPSRHTGAGGSRDNRAPVMGHDSRRGASCGGIWLGLCYWI